MREPEEVVRRVRERTEQYETMQKNDAKCTMGKRKGHLRAVLLLTGIAVLMLGVFTATAGREYVARFLALFGAKNSIATIGDAFILIGQSAKFGDYTVTVEDMIGDANIMWVEISTDCAVDAPDGWLASDGSLLWFTLNIKGEINLPEDSRYACGFGWQCTPFVRDGKLWYMFMGKIYRDIEGKYSADFGKMPVQITVTGHDWRDGGQTYSHDFKWNNDYTAKRETYSVNRQAGNCTITEVSATITGLEIVTTAENVSYITIDHIKLDNGTVLDYQPADSIFCDNGSHRSTWTRKDGMKVYSYYFSFLSEFRLKDPAETQVVPFEHIASISVNGVEIPLR